VNLCTFEGQIFRARNGLGGGKALECTLDRTTEPMGLCDRYEGEAAVSGRRGLRERGLIAGERVGAATGLDEKAAVTERVSNMSSGFAASAPAREIEVIARSGCKAAACHLAASRQARAARRSCALSRCSA
jgi:hypothetical protein